VEEQAEVEPQLKQLDEYLSGPHYLFVLTMHHVHVARRMSKGVVRL